MKNIEIKNLTPEELNYLRVHTCIAYNTFEEGMSLNSKDRSTPPEDYVFLGTRVFTDREGITNDYPTYMWENEADALVEFFHKRSTNHNVAEDFKTLIDTNIKYGVFNKDYKDSFMKDLADVKKYKVNFEDVEDYRKHPYESGYYGNGWLRDTNPIYDLPTDLRGILAEMYDDEFITTWTWKEIA